MRSPALRIFIILLSVWAGCMIIPIISYAQDYTQPGFQLPGGSNNTANRYGDLNQAIANPFASLDEDTTAVRSDSTKQKIRKPLESYLFDDSTRVRPNFAWHLDTYRNKIELVDIDTTMNGFQIDYPFLEKGVGAAYQGNLGGASIPLNYFDRPSYQDFSFAQAYDAYHFFSTNVDFFNVKKPFTRFEYQTAGQKKYAEERFRITHAQNISPSSGFNVDYKSRGTRGIYNWNKGRAKNFSLAFSHTGKKYTIHAGYIYNTINNKENGGITDIRNVTDSIFELPENIPTFLNDARNIIKNNTFYAVQSYGIPLSKLTIDDFSIADRSSIFLGHSIEYSRWHKNYTDTRAESQRDDLIYYENWYIDPAITNDSIFESRLSNRVFVQLQPWDRDGIIGLIDAGVGMDNHLYYQFRPSQYITGGTNNHKENSYYIYGSVDGKFRKFVNWGGDINFHPAGYRLGDLNVGAHISLSAYLRGNPITLTGKFYHDRRSPSYWSENFFSNHYVWSNSFDKENETRFEASLTMPSAGIEIGAGQSVINNKIYYGENRLPTQSSESVSVTGLYARKDFRLGGFHLNHRVLLQWSTSQEVVPVPLASAYLSYYFEFNVVKNVLRMQFGIDGRYNTLYYAYGWNPATATFYNQRERQVGEYPMLDVFVNAKWKRMRILLKMAHLNDDMFGSRNYFSLPNYPLNKRIFKFGFSWTFYD